MICNYTLKKSLYFYPLSLGMDCDITILNKKVKGRARNVNAWIILHQKDPKQNRVPVTLTFSFEVSCLLNFLSMRPQSVQMHYETTLEKLRFCIKLKCPGMLSNSIIFMIMTAHILLNPIKAYDSKILFGNATAFSIQLKSLSMQFQCFWRVEERHL